MYADKPPTVFSIAKMFYRKLSFQATCKQFYHYCSLHGVALARRNFSLRYDTNIPRQVGLAGSSAIVTATLR
jgi:shikimate kinase